MRYQGVVRPDGTWRVTLLMHGGDPGRTVAVGTAKDMERGEVAARYAIEDDKARRAKDQVMAQMIHTFEVPA